MKISKSAFIVPAALIGLTFGLSGCDKTETSSKTTTTTTQKSPQGDAKTTTTTEKKTEIDPK